VLLPPRPLTGIDAEEFRVLKLVLDVLCPRLLPAALLTDEIDPSRQLERLVRRAPRAALRGLREAVDDLMEATQDLKGDQLEELDSALQAAGAPTVTDLHRRRTRRVLEVLRAGEVASDQEYRLLAAVLSDVDSPMLSPSDRRLAETLLCDRATRSDDDVT
jgi:hypothetical protein